MLASTRDRANRRASRTFSRFRYCNMASHPETRRTVKPALAYASTRPRTLRFRTCSQFKLYNHDHHGHAPLDDRIAPSRAARVPPTGTSCVETSFLTRSVALIPSVRILRFSVVRRYALPCIWSDARHAVTLGCWTAASGKKPPFGSLELDRRSGRRRLKVVVVYLVRFAQIAVLVLASGDAEVTHD